jgi:hypothetical protein
MSRWHINNQTSALAFGDFLEFLGEYFMVASADKLRPDMFYVVDKTTLALILYLEAV